jgi:hypothetical protein
VIGAMNHAVPIGEDLLRLVIAAPRPSVRAWCRDPNLVMKGSPVRIRASASQGTPCKEATSGLLTSDFWTSGLLSGSGRGSKELRNGSVGTGGVHQNPGWPLPQTSRSSRKPAPCSLRRCCHTGIAACELACRPGSGSGWVHRCELLADPLSQFPKPCRACCAIDEHSLDSRARSSAQLVLLPVAKGPSLQLRRKLERPGRDYSGRSRGGGGLQTAGRGCQQAALPLPQDERKSGSQARAS